MSAKADPLAVPCPQCDQPAGAKCRNYKGSGCAPHRERAKLAAGEPPLPAGPIVCRPVGSLPLADVRGFPAEAAARLAAAGVVTLADLEAAAAREQARCTAHEPPYARGQTLTVTQAVYKAIEHAGVPLADAWKAGDAVVDHLTVPPVPAAGGIGKTRVRGELPRPTPPTAPPTPPTADQWDEHTPPPRRRPQGTPVRAYEVLPAGEDAAAVFAGWDAAGRVPAGSVLLRHVGTGLAAVSGYTLAAGTLAGCGVGGAVPLGVLDTLRLVSTVRVAGAGAWVVMAPEEGGAA